MASKRIIRIRYFDVRGRVEPIRLLLEDASIPYEETPQTDIFEWRNIKKETPWHTVRINLHLFYSKTLIV